MEATITTPSTELDRSEAAPARVSVSGGDARFARAAHLLLAVGVVLRLMQYAGNRSLWMDEALLAPTILGHSFSELLNPGIWGPTPPGFLFAVKAMTWLFGGSELVLRLIPLLGGIAALFLFHAVAGRVMARPAALFALGLFAVSPFLIYYASELKPYSTDAALALALLWLALRLRDRGVSMRDAAWLCVAGVAAAGFSYASALVLAGVTAALLAHFARRGDRASVQGLLGACAVWAVVFGVPYLLVMRGVATSDYAQSFWRSGFMPLPPRSLAELAWFPRTALRTFVEPLGVLDSAGRGTDRWQAAAGIAVFTLGCVAMVRSRRGGMLMLIVAPVLVTLLASGFRKYPFGGEWSTGGRVILFLAPAFYLVMGEGAAWLWGRFRGAARVPALAVLALLVGPVAVQAAVAFPFGRAEIKPILAYVQDNWRSGDILYVHYDTRPAFRYYAGRFGFDAAEYRLGRCARFTPNEYLAELSRMGGERRVWVLIGGGIGAYNYDEKSLITGYLDSVARRLDDRVARGASVYLYDLSTGVRAGGYRVRIPEFPQAIEEGCAIYGG